MPVNHAKTETPTRQRAAALATELRRWLASGDLQSSSGAFHAWRDLDRDLLAHEYPEITGYALTWLAGRPAFTSEEDLAGRRAADWLVARLESGDKSARTGWDGNAIYTFDLGMIAAGLISFGRRVGEDRYVRQGRQLALELACLVASERGLEPITSQREVSTRSISWSTRGRAHLAKGVQSLLLAGQDDAADVLVRRTFALERERGRFQTQPEDGHVMLHPHLYATEGIWIWGTARNDSGALDLARRATEWAWQHQLASGGLPRFVSWDNDSGPAPEQSDVTSQAIRLAVGTGAKVDGLERAVERLCTLATPGSNGSALTYSPESDANHQNAWVTMFGAQALELIASGQSGMTWEQLV